MCLIAISLIMLAWLLVTNHRMNTLQNEHISLLLQKEATLFAMQSNADNIPAQSTQSNLPIYFDLNRLESVKHSAQWPSDCGLPSSEIQWGEVFRLECSHNLRLYGLSTQTKTTNGMSPLVLWTLAPSPDITEQVGVYWLTMGGILAVFLSLLGGSLISRTMAITLREIERGAQRMHDGDYGYRLRATGIAEADGLVNAFNNMGAAIEERDTYFRKTAFVDRLTGLDNRSFLILSLNDRVKTAREPLLIATWAIDNIEDVYDVLGQDMVNLLLQKVARKVKLLCPGHVALARMEGAVFCLVAPLSQVKKIDALKARRLLFTQVKINGYSLEVNCHCGLSLYPDHGAGAETLLRRSDVARQLAKKSNQPMITFEPKMEQRSADRLALIGELRRAIANREFEMFLQPKLNLKSGQVTQAEGLIRWRHPSRGIISPAGFIGIAEQTGLIKEISRWALEDGFEKSVALGPYNIGVSLNISAIDLEDEVLLNHARQLDDDHPGISHMITLEVTESSTIRDPEAACELLQKFADLGFKIAVDDFGAGYSSLAYLKRFPVTELKIDRSLVTGVDQNTDAAIIMQSTIEMGHTMGLVVTVEGVETRSEFDLVSDLGADFIQGYYLSAPIPLDEFCERHFIPVQLQATQPA